MTLSTPRGTDISNMKRTYRTAVADDSPRYAALPLMRAAELRYGENPNQPGMICKTHELADEVTFELVKGGKGGWSATNFMDASRALDILKFFSQYSSVAVMKHLIPSGFATWHHPADTLAEIYVRARDADKRSAFGSVVVTNVPMDLAIADAILETYVEAVGAPSFEEGVLDKLKTKKDLRAIEIKGIDKIPKYVGDDTRGRRDVRTLPSGHALVQAPYLTSVKSFNDLVLDPLVVVDGVRHVVEQLPTPDQVRDMLTAWYINIGTRSNGIVIVKDGVTLAVGSGKQERVRALSDALRTAYLKEMDRRGIEFDEVVDAIPAEIMAEKPFKGASLSSDAFFPQRDSIDMAAAHGIEAIIQPFGSIKDAEIIDAANEHRIAMAATLERCFAHF